MIFFDLIKYDFVYYAYMAIAMISVICGLLGSFVVLGKMSSLGDAISHISFGAMSLALAFSSFPDEIALIIVIVSAVVLDRFSKIDALHGESAVSILSLSAISIGIIATSFKKNHSINVSSYLFGSALLVSKSDLYWILLLFITVLLSVIMLYGDFLYNISNIECVKKDYKSYKSLYGILFKILASVTIFCSARFLGAILISSLLVFPASISMIFVKSFKNSLIVSSFLSAFLGIIGLSFAIFLDLPVGATIALLSSMVFVISLLKRKKI